MGCAPFAATVVIVLALDTLPHTHGKIQKYVISYDANGIQRFFNDSGNGMDYSTRIISLGTSYDDYRSRNRY